MNLFMAPTKTLHANAAAAARLLRALANTSRLLILCHLFRHGESSAGSLASELGIGMSALSQHLSRMRDQGLISQRRQSRQIFYQVSDSSSAQLPSLLASICDDAPSLPPHAANDAPKASTLAAVLDLAFVGSGALAADGFWQAPAIQAAGKIHPLPQAAYQPDATSMYKMVFELTSAAAEPGAISPGLQRVARTVNLYVNAGVPLKHLRLVAVASGAATAMALNDAKYQKQYGTPNPNLPVIKQLCAAGVDIAVCGQALAEYDYPYDWIDKRVTLALSALTTISELQQKGYALMPL
jgi:DNA-binding transcriptional ArsR family regulator/intracellular sulfur oxidation DsrE/DsrF family protein